MNWISFKTQMPELGTWVLGYTVGGGIATIRRVGSRNLDEYDRLDWMLPAHLRDDCVFTHWMPMPEEPKD